MKGLLTAVILLMSSPVNAGDQLPKMVSLTALGNSTQCDEPKMAVDWLKDLSQHSHFNRSIPLQSNQQLLLVSMGIQPSSGYRLTLADQTAQLEKGILHLQLQWHSPAPGQMNAQVITQPCLLLSLPKQHYQGVNIYDQQGKLRIKSLLESP